MLGNFSFGDYFKKEAIPWAWELLTEGYGIPREKLYVTIFEGAMESHADIPRDDEAYHCWRALGIPDDRIFALGMKENFWQMGDTGPCGPCSEIHYDMGPAASDLGHTDCKFPCDCGRYVEIWNLVFMQYNRSVTAGGLYEFSLLPRPCVDTGAGLERLAAVLQGKISNFDTDLFQPLIEKAAELANVEYEASTETDISLRIIADHSRAATFLISDGVLPSNEGRGYVLRLIMRRALYHGQTLGLDEPFLYKISGEVVELMKAAYPELVENAQHVAKAIKIEEERYAHTTRVGLERLDEAHVVLATGKTLRFDEYKSIVGAHPGTLLPPGVVRGDDLFRLHDTFGLRPDFVQDVVKNYGLSIDWEGYNIEMERQRERARASWKGAERKAAPLAYHTWAEKQPTIFDGYTQTTSTDCRVLALLVNGEPVPSIPARTQVEIVLDHTPFYAEAGGQVGDTGRLFLASTGDEIAFVSGAQRPVAGLIVHQSTALQPLEVGMLVTAEVDAKRRDAIRRNHTATHLLHAALRNILGTHVKQAGSLVAPDRLRFDFTHYSALNEQDLLDIEDLVNQHILVNEEVHTDVMTLDAALNSGAMALFGEKYGDQVRVVSVGDGSFSKELCGGTHVRRTGDIGLFKVTAEGSVAAGTRRIEALTGTGLLEYLRKAGETLTQLGEVLRAKPEELLGAAEKLSESEKKLRRQLEAQQLKRAAASAGDLVENAREVKGVRVLSARIEALDRPAMRQMVDNLRTRLGSGVIVLGSASDGKVSLVAAVSKDLTSRLDAGKIVKAAAAIVEGSGGGRKDLAEAGGKNPAKLDESLQAVPRIVESML